MTGERYALFLGCLVPARLPQIEVSVRRVFDLLDVEFLDLPEFSCCPNSPYIKPLDQEAWLAVAARNLCIAEEEGLEIATPCPGCSNTLIEAKHMLDSDEELRGRVNRRLATVDRGYRGETRVKHLLQVLVEDVGLDRVKGIVEREVPVGLASHYGCHLLKPHSVLQFENPFEARSLEDLTEILGGTAVDYENRDLCCGMVLGSTDQEGSLELAHRKLLSAKEAGAGGMLVTCPTCFLQFDTGQLRASRSHSMRYDLPVLYFAQLIGLAAGLPGEDLGLGMHRIKADRIVDLLD